MRNLQAAEILHFSKRLLRNRLISKMQFIDLCRQVLHYIDLDSSSDRLVTKMAFDVTELWLRFEFISEDIFLGEVGGQFSDWETNVPRALIKKSASYKETVEWLERAKKKYAPQYSDPPKFIEAENYPKGQITKKDYIKLCLQVEQLFDDSKRSEKDCLNLISFVAKLWYENPELGVDDEELDYVGAQFSRWAEEHSVDLGDILNRHAWERVKETLISLKHRYL